MLSMKREKICNFFPFFTSLSFLEGLNQDWFSEDLFCPESKQNGQLFAKVRVSLSFPLSRFLKLLQGCIQIIDGTIFSSYPSRIDIIRVLYCFLIC